MDNANKQTIFFGRFQYRKKWIKLKAYLLREKKSQNTNKVVVFIIFIRFGTLFFDANQITAKKKRLNKKVYIDIITIDHRRKELSFHNSERVIFSSVFFLFFFLR